MAEVTEGDRRRAMEVMAWDPLDYESFAKAVNDGNYPADREALELVDAIAAALAEEREKARQEGFNDGVLAGMKTAMENGR